MKVTQWAIWAPVLTQHKVKEGVKTKGKAFWFCFFTAIKCVRRNLALSALAPEQEVWERKEQRHLRQMDASHCSSGSNLVMLTGSCAPGKMSSQELGNQSPLTCRQWLAKSATKSRQHWAMQWLGGSACLALFS